MKKKSKAAIDHTKLWDKIAEEFLLVLDTLSEPTPANFVLEKALERLGIEISKTKTYPTCWSIRFRQQVGAKTLENPMVLMSEAQKEKVEKALTMPMAEFSIPKVRNVEGGYEIKNRRREVLSPAKGDQGKSSPSISPEKPVIRYDLDPARIEVLRKLNQLVAMDVRKGKIRPQIDLVAHFKEAMTHGGLKVSYGSTYESYIEQCRPWMERLLNDAVDPAFQFVIVREGKKLEVDDRVNLTLMNLCGRIKRLEEAAENESCELPDSVSHYGLIDDRVGRTPPSKDNASPASRRPGYDSYADERQLSTRLVETIEWLREQNRQIVEAISAIPEAVRQELKAALEA